MSGKRLLVIVLSLLLGFGSLALYRSVGWAQYAGSFRPLTLDLARPDVLIRTRSLSALPRDLLRVPLARDVLTEDFVFYYEEHPDRLGLKGALRRIAYEHELKWQDQVLAWVLDQPAEIALWRGATGTPTQWVAAVTRRELAQVLQEAATVALKDRQLTVAGKIKVDGQQVELYALEYSAQHTLLIAARGERVAILSDPGLLLTAEREPRPEAEAVLQRLLSADAGRQAVYRDAFLLDADYARHSVAVRTHLLSFGYQRFFPGFEAVRFDFDDKAWSTHALLDGTRLPTNALHDRELWSALPANPAACALLPVDWQRTEPMLAAAPEIDGRKPSALAAEMDGPAGVCWYSQGRLHAPLFAATLKAPRDNLAPLFEAVFNWSITTPADTDAGEPAPPASDEGMWQRTVDVPFAGADDSGRPRAAPMKVTLMRQGRYLLFSPDAARVEQAAAALAKRYPSLAGTLQDKGITLAVIAPRSLSEMAQKEALAMLPAGSEPVFRAAAERQLVPRLAAMKKYPAYRLVLVTPPNGAHRWYAVQWQELRK